MSPRCVQRSDIYSLGVTLYEALTLTLPFEGDTEEKYISGVLAGKCIPARRRNKRISRDLEIVLAKATEQDPDRRYATAAELCDDLRAVLAGLPVKAKKTSVPRRVVKMAVRHRRALVTNLGLLAIAAACWVAITQWHRQSQLAARIEHTLSVAVTSKTEPMKIDSKWPDVASTLLDHVINGPIDSATRLSSTLMTTPQYQYQRY